MYIFERARQDSFQLKTSPVYVCKLTSVADMCGCGCLQLKLNCHTFVS